MSTMFEIYRVNVPHQSLIQLEDLNHLHNGGWERALVDPTQVAIPTLVARVKVLSH